MSSNDMWEDDMPEPAGAEWHTVQPSETWMETYERLLNVLLDARYREGHSAGARYYNSRLTTMVSEARAALDAHVRAVEPDAPPPTKGDDE